jgi:isoleucyl-tRNA synthetase
VVDAYRRIRNTLRFLLANTSDFDPATDAVAPAEMLEIDRWLLARAASSRPRCWRITRCTSSTPWSPSCSCSARKTWAASTWTCKDRLYTTQPKSLARRSAQTALWQLTQALLRWMAPFLSFTAEEAWKLVGASESIFLEEFWRFDAPDAALLAKWARIRALREVANKEIEAVREPAPSAHRCRPSCN